MRVPDPRRIKINFPYLIHEIAKACKVTRGTVRRWRKEGLKAVDECKPYLFLGAEVRAFLESKRKRHKRRLAPGEIYCVRCHAPKAPASNCVEYRSRTSVIGSLIGACPDCGCVMFRHVNIERLDMVRATLQVRMANDSHD